MLINNAVIKALKADPLKIKKKYKTPSVKRDERIGDLRLMRLMFKAVVSADAAASRNGLQSLSRVREKRSAEINYQKVVVVVREEHAIPLLTRCGNLDKCRSI